MGNNVNEEEQEVNTEHPNGLLVCVRARLCACVCAWLTKPIYLCCQMSLMHCSGLYIKHRGLMRLIFIFVQEPYTACWDDLISLGLFIQLSVIELPRYCNLLLTAVTLYNLPPATTHPHLPSPPMHADRNGLWKIKVAEIWIVLPIFYNNDGFMRLHPSHIGLMVEGGIYCR